MPTENDVLEALKGVAFPGLSRDIVSFGFIHDLKVEGSRASFTIRMKTEKPEAVEEIVRNAEAKVLAIDGIESVDIRKDVVTRDARIPTGGSLPPTVQRIHAMAGVKNTIAVASGKGGVGKSTVATNLALALARQGNSVAILDSDIYGPSQQMMLGLHGKPMIDQKSNRIIPMERHGVKTMSLGLIADPDTPVIWRGPMVKKALDQFLGDVEWGEVDYMIFDMPPGTGDAQLTIAQQVPLSGAIIVTTPQDISLIDARKGLAMFRKIDVPIFGLVENMSYFICRHCGEREEIFGHGGGRRTAALLDVPFLGEIPIDPRVVIGGDSGEPIVALDPESIASQAFIEIASRIVSTLVPAGSR
ncbi:MAG: Mrp/NBP35 family ATP-binding protein [Acidobacteria bacterium]|nr:Mrp/NBP35 family ATP-binding protein [Acidobacteriota bacterium]